MAPISLIHGVLLVGTTASLMHDYVGFLAWPLAIPASVLPCWPALLAHPWMAGAAWGAQYALIAAWVFGAWWVVFLLYLVASYASPAEG